jgi:hypothetical protein
LHVVEERTFVAVAKTLPDAIVPAVYKGIKAFAVIPLVANGVLLKRTA